MVGVYLCNRAVYFFDALENSTTVGPPTFFFMCVRVSQLLLPKAVISHDDVLNFDGDKTAGKLRPISATQGLPESDDDWHLAIFAPEFSN